jgi:hypothetical protein
VTTDDALAPAVATERESWLARWAPLGGLAFVAGFVALIISIGEPGDTPAEVIAYAESHSGRLDAMALFALLSLLLLGWFVGGLHVRLLAVGARLEATFALAAGAAFALIFFVTMMIWHAPLLELDDEGPANLKTSQAETFLGIEDIGWFTLAGAGVSAGVMIMAASLGARRGGLVPAWAAWVGVALGIASLATVAFFGLIAWLLWILVASVLMLWRKPATAM